MVAATGGDKKNVGGVRRFVLPVGIGDAGVVEDVTPAEFEAAVGYMLARAACGDLADLAGQQVQRIEIVGGIPPLDAGNASRMAQPALSCERNWHPSAGNLRRTFMDGARLPLSSRAFI